MRFSHVKRYILFICVSASALVTFWEWQRRNTMTPEVDRLVDVHFKEENVIRNKIVYPMRKRPYLQDNNKKNDVQVDIVQSPHKVDDTLHEAEESRQNAVVDDLLDIWQKQFNERGIPAGNNGQDTQENIPLWFRRPGMEDSMGQQAVFMGNLRKDTKKFAVFSTTTSNREALGFAFYVPLTVLAWQRIGYGSIVIIVGSAVEWQSDPLLNFILTQAVELNAFIVFLQPRAERSIMISQLSRIFAANIVNTTSQLLQDCYILTTDTDLWPLKEDAYNLKEGKYVLALNSECCGGFVHRNEYYKMVPMANIGMTGKRWQEITTKYFFSATTTEDIITFVLREFGNVAFEQVHKGDNGGWFLDQRLVSVLIQDWDKRQPDPSKVQYVPRDVGNDRIDRAGWDTEKIESKTDAHLLDNGYIPGHWAQLMPLLQYMYGVDSENMQWCVKYFDKFTQLYLDMFRQNGRGA